MAWYNKVVNFFVKDSAERRRFMDKFNYNAITCFQQLAIDALFEAVTSSGNEDPSFRHELSAPRYASGFEIQVKAGSFVSKDEILLIGQFILLNEPIMRTMFVLHWDTLIIRDVRTGNSISWRIKDFINFGGLLYVPTK